MKASDGGVRTYLEGPLQENVVHCVDPKVRPNLYVHSNYQIIERGDAICGLRGVPRRFCMRDPQEYIPRNCIQRNRWNSVCSYCSKEAVSDPCKLKFTLW